MNKFFAASNTTVSITDSSGITLTDCQLMWPAVRTGTASQILQLSRCSDVTTTRLNLIGGYFTFSGSNYTITDTKYADSSTGGTVTGQSSWGVICGLNQTGPVDTVTVSGFLLFSTSAPPTLSLVAVNQGSTNIKIRNIGTSASPLDLNNLCASAVNPQFATGTQRDVLIQRVYVSNTTNGLVDTISAFNGIVVENCSGDYSDNQSLTGRNINLKSLRSNINTGVNSANIGTHFVDYYTSTTAGNIALLFNDPSPETTSYVTTISGTPEFNGAGLLKIGTVGDSIEYEWNYQIHGHTSFTKAVPTANVGSPQNWWLQYKIDTGSGYSALKNLWLYKTGGGGSNGSFNVTMTSTTDVAVGDYVFGTNIGTNAKVTSITNSTTVVVDVANSGTVSGTLKFCHLPSETISPAGFGLKVRITCTTADTSTWQYLKIATDTTITDQQNNLYPLDVIDVTMQNLEANSTYRIYNDTDATELATGSSVSGGNVTEQFELGSGKTISFRIGGEQNILFTTSGVTTSSGLSVYVSQIGDNFRTVSNTTALAYSGITVVGNTSVTISGTRTIQELYEYLMAWQQQSGDLQYAVPISTADGATFIINTTNYTWSVTGSLTGLSDTLSGFTAAMVGTGGFFEDATGAIWEASGDKYSASHFYINVKNNSSNANIQDAIVSYIETTTNTDKTYNTSRTLGGVLTNSSGNAEGYAVWKKNSTTYSGHKQLVGEYNYDWSSIPVTVTGVSLGTSSSYTGIRLVPDNEVVLSKASALAITGITINTSSKIADLNDKSNQNGYDNLKARQARANDIETGIPGYLSFYTSGLIIDYDGSFYNGISTWEYRNQLNSAGLGTWKTGIINLDTPGDINLDYNAVTFKYSTAGTYDHRNEVMDGAIVLTNSSGGAVVVQLDTGVSYTNSGPSITVDASVAVDVTLNCADSSGNATNFTTGTRVQIYNISGASADAWTSSTLYTEGDKVLRTSGVGTESGAGLWYECTAGGTSSGSEPTWNTTLDGTTTDGGVTWTTRPIEMYNDAPGAVTYITVNYTYIASSTIRFRIIAVNGITNAEAYQQTTGSVSVTGLSTSITQSSNTIYMANNINGSLVTECSISSNGIDIFVDDPDNVTTAQRIYAWYQYYLTTAAGIRDSSDLIVAADQTHYTFDNTLQIKNLDTSNPLNITGANIVPASGNATNVFDLSNGASIAINFNRVEGFAYSSGSGLSPEEHNQLLAIPTTTPTAGLTLGQFIALK